MVCSVPNLLRSPVRPVLGPVVQSLAHARLKGVSYLPEATALFARFTSQPNATRKALINDTIGSFIDAGLWAKAVSLKFYAAHDAQAARRNWIADAANSTPVAAPAFTADVGYKGDGASSYLNDNMVPATAGLITADSVTIAAWPTDDISGVGRRHFAVRDTTGSDRLLSLESASDNRLITQLGLSPTLQVATIGSTGGFLVGSRTGASAMALYKNGASVGTSTSSSAALPNRPIYTGAYNNAGTLQAFSANNYAFTGILTGLSGAEVSDLYDIVHTYLQAVGAVA